MQIFAAPPLLLMAAWPKWLDKLFPAVVVVAVLFYVADKIRSRRRARRTRYRRPGTPFFIIDGSNVCRSYVRDRKFHGEVLVTLCLELKERGFDFHCVFDANAIYVAGEEAGPPQRKMLEMFLRSYADHFSSVRARTVADEFFLKMGDLEDGAIISNDKFVPYVRDYPWVTQEARVLRGSVAEASLHLPHLGIHVPVVDDLQQAVKRLRGFLDGKALPSRPKTPKTEPVSR